jgi:hypothetical protein
VSDQIKNFAVIYLVDISEVPDFNAMYELYDPCTVMFFFRNKVLTLVIGWEGRKMHECLHPLQWHSIRVRALLILTISSFSYPQR